MRSHHHAVGSFLTFASTVFISGVLLSSHAGAAEEDGFIDLFDGKSLDGWVLVDQTGDGFGVTNGELFCASGGGGNLFTRNDYSDFVLRLEFKLPHGANNGIGIRAPLEGDAAYEGMELQMLDETAAKEGKWGSLRPTQFHGSIYDVIPAGQGALKPPGEWNEQEIVAVGRQISVKLNGQMILDADLNQVTDAQTIRKHPGLFRQAGHIGFLGHGDRVAFRNIRIKELGKPKPDNVAPQGFSALFNGRDLSGWKGLVGGPPKRAGLSAEELEAAQSKADDLMRQDWKIEDGSLVYRGSGFDNLVSQADYGDFELQVDWRITPPTGDSGIYLRGVPQVQIWNDPVGSGGLFNNKSHLSTPLKRVDKDVGEWNRFRILMVGDQVTVFLNDALVVKNVPLENYWERDKPVYESGPVELQAHRDAVCFKNIYLRELPRH